jgi:hypothetical protein
MQDKRQFFFRGGGAASPLTISSTVVERVFIDRAVTFGS